MQRKTTFIGELSNPFFSPTATRGLVEFVVHPLQKGRLLNNQAQLISSSGDIYPVTVRGTGYVHPGATEKSSWHPGDFLVRIDGITLEQAQFMRKIVQEHVEEGTPFIAEVLEAHISSKNGFVEVRVRPQPYGSIVLKEAQIVTQSGETISVILRRAEAAPASPTEGRFGDLIISLEGITLEQARFAQKLVQEQS